MLPSESGPRIGLPTASAPALPPTVVRYMIRGPSDLSYAVALCLRQALSRRARAKREQRIYQVHLLSYMMRSPLRHSCV